MLTESFLPGIGSASTSPGWTSNAAKSDAVPWRMYSHSRRILRFGAGGWSLCLRCLACTEVFSSTESTIALSGQFK